MRGAAPGQWEELPYISWPHDIPLPTFEELIAAAEYATGVGNARNHSAEVIYMSAMIPWLVGRFGYSGHRACLACGRSRHLVRGETVYRLMTSPAGQAITDCVTRRLHKNFLDRME